MKYLIRWSVGPKSKYATYICSVLNHMIAQWDDQPDSAQEFTDHSSAQEVMNQLQSPIDGYYEVISLI